MRKLVVFVLCLLLGSAACAFARGRYEKVKDCADLDACMAILDTAVLSRDNDTELGDEHHIAEKLETFGDAAKKSLFTRAIGSNGDWRRYAGLVLQYWPNFDARDVPALAQTLTFEEGGWAADPLFEIRTPAALRALLADVGRFHWPSTPPHHNAMELKASALPHMLGALEVANESSRYQLQMLISILGRDAIPVVRPWAAIALDGKQPLADRVAALNGLTAIGINAAFISPRLHDLLQSKDATLRSYVVKALGSMGDPIAYQQQIPATLEKCRPRGDPFSSYASAQDWGCASRLAAFGPGLLPYGEEIEIEFLNSPSGLDRAIGESLLGFAGYRPAIPRLIESLGDPDWRVVRSAVHALGWLGAKEALASLQNVAASYWLPEVRVDAALTIDALHSPAGAVERTPKMNWPDGTLYIPGFGNGEAFLRPAPACSSKHWRWLQNEFSGPPKSTVDSTTPTLEFADGTLAGVTRSGFEYAGGALEWRPKQGAPTDIYLGIVEGLAPLGDDAIAVINDGEYSLPDGSLMADAGFAAVANRKTGSWSLREIAQFPAPVDMFANIQDNLYVAWSAGRAIVFSPNGLQGIADCEIAKPSIQ